MLIEAGARFYASVTFSMNLPVTWGCRRIGISKLPKDLMGSESWIFFLSRSRLCCFFASWAISFALTEPKAAFTGFHGDHDSYLLQILCELLCICKALGGLFCLTLFLELQIVFIFLIGFDTQLFGDDKVPCISITDVDNIALFAERFYIL